MATPLENTAPATLSRRKLIMLIAAGALVLLGVIWAVPTWYYAHTHETTDDSQVDGHIIPVLAKVGGYVTAVAVHDNDSVRAGQLLVRIDSAEYRVKLAQADADLAAARAIAGSRGNGGQAGALVASAAGQRSSLDAQIDAARAYHAKTQSDLARQKELVAKQIVSAQALDNAEAAERAAAAQVQSLERQATAASAGVSGAEAGVRMADARMAAAQAARDNAALQLSYTSVTAPAAGIVAKKLVEIGQLVQAGQQMMSIVADSGVWVTANFKETQLAAMQAPDSRWTSRSMPTAASPPRARSRASRAATGARFALLPPDNATGNFTKVVQRVPVRIRVTQGLGPARPLRPGMSAVVSVKTK